MLDLQGRRQAAEDTIRRTPVIAAEAAIAAGGGDFLHSFFISKQLPPLDKASPLYHAFPHRPVEVHNSDAFALARSLAPTPTNKVGVLNLANSDVPGGGWRYSLCKTQEEALCYSSTLYATLRPEWFPFPNTGPGSDSGIMTPSVVVFKDTLDHDLVDLPIEQRFVVSVMTVAAPVLPKLSGEEFADEAVLQDLREKILLTLRMAAMNGCTSLVLGAMGCGVFRCPPRAVAREMAAALSLEEFVGWFERVTFAVFVGRPSDQQNLELFKEAFEEVKI